MDFQIIFLGVSLFLLIITSNHVNAKEPSKQPKLIQREKHPLFVTPEVTSSSSPTPDEAVMVIEHQPIEFESESPTESPSSILSSVSYFDQDHSRKGARFATSPRAKGLRVAVITRLGQTMATHFLMEILQERMLSRRHKKMLLIDQMEVKNLFRISSGTRLGQSACPLRSAGKGGLMLGRGVSVRRDMS